MRLKLTLAALAASVAFAPSANAQVVIPPSTDTGQARGTVLRPLSVNADETLDFGTVLANGTLGWVEVSAETGGRSVDGGGGVDLVSLDSGGRGTFIVTSTAGRSVDLTVVPPTTLANANGNLIDVLDFRMDGLPAGGVTDTRVTPASGLFVVGVGGRFEIDATQENGIYTADYTLTAEY